MFVGRSAMTWRTAGFYILLYFLSLVSGEEEDDYMENGGGLVLTWPLPGLRASVRWLFDMAAHGTAKISYMEDGSLFFLFLFCLRKTEKAWLPFPPFFLSLLPVCGRRGGGGNSLWQLCSLLCNLAGCGRLVLQHHVPGYSVVRHQSIRLYLYWSEVCEWC
ncbi:hypothetical protein B0T22DRAFT_305639 [Podospora appendiculata]|uniref:Secreted protein n=1 Tax=Podospora appendiculata TaxID=314037 RepID=A0AAE1C7F4_9PEZI|nr:hypothetical protein B0T22DRAFT_305639 [Podospora appendiculata]